MAVRLRDVADQSGVSIKTASNVVHNHPHVKASTRARVQQAIDDLGYRPNLSARRLRYGKSGFLAVALPRLDSPYFAELAAKLSERAGAMGQIVLLDSTGATPEAERLVLKGVSTHIIDGVIFSPLALTAEEIASRTDTVPMVLLGERIVPAGYDHVAVDSVSAARAMTEHLIGLDRTRVAAIGRKSAVGTHSVRLTGYRQALAAAGLPFDRHLVRGVAHYDREAGRQAMHSLLRSPSPPDAIFCFNDLMAIGAIRACHEAQVRVPDDIAVAGFDDIAEGQFSSPSLTTVSPDLDVLAAEALRLILARIDGDDGPAQDVSVPWELVIRESTVGTTPPH
jgi:DNA-binding LacI/PurR family transcriptional regulator